MSTQVERIDVQIDQIDPSVTGLQITFDGDLTDETKQNLKDQLLQAENGSLEDIIRFVGPQLTVGTSVSILRDDLKLTVSKKQAESDF